MSKTDKVQDDFNEPVRCAECGEESGPFVMDTDDREILCYECHGALPTDERRDFNNAVEASSNLDVEERRGKIVVYCVQCCERLAEFDEDNLLGATEFIEKDEEHECEEGGDDSTE